MPKAAQRGNELHQAAPRDVDVRDVNGVVRPMPERSFVGGRHAQDVSDHPHRHRRRKGRNDIRSGPCHQFGDQVTREVVDHRAPRLERSARERRLNLLTHPRVCRPVGRQQHRQLNPAHRHALRAGHHVVGACRGADVGMTAEHVDAPPGAVVHRPAGQELPVAGIRVGGGDRVERVEVSHLHAPWNGPGRHLEMGQLGDVGRQRARNEGAVCPGQSHVTFQCHVSGIRPPCYSYVK